MTEAHNIKVKNRLGELMRQPGGRSVIDAIRTAESRVEKNRDTFVVALDRAIGRLEAAGASLTEQQDPQRTAEIYAAANDMIAMAGLVGFQALDEVAHGLCDLIDVLRAEGAWSAGAIKVHVDSVLLLRGLRPQDELAREKILDGLRQVWIRFGVEPGAR